MLVEGAGWETCGAACRRTPINVMPTPKPTRALKAQSRAPLCWTMRWGIRCQRIEAYIQTPRLSVRIDGTVGLVLPSFAGPCSFPVQYQWASALALASWPRRHLLPERPSNTPRDTMSPVEKAALGR